MILKMGLPTCSSDSFGSTLFVTANDFWKHTSKSEVTRWWGKSLHLALRAMSQRHVSFPDLTHVHLELWSVFCFPQAPMIAYSIVISVFISSGEKRARWGLKVEKIWCLLSQRAGAISSCTLALTKKKKSKPVKHQEADVWCITVERFYRSVCNAESKLCDISGDLRLGPGLSRRTSSSTVWVGPAPWSKQSRGS